MWDQCDTTNTQMNGNGRMWTIGQREFEICFFKFDLLKFQCSKRFTNFEPLNLNGWTIDTFDRFGIALETENI